MGGKETEGKEREGGKREKKRYRAKERGSSDGLAGREHEDPKRGQRENDKGERDGRFDWKGRQRGLFPFTSVFSVLRSVLSVVPIRAHTKARTHRVTCTHTRVLFSFCPPSLPTPRLRRPPVPIFLRSLCRSPPLAMPFYRLRPPRLVIVRTCVCVYARIHLVSIVV